MSTKASIHYDEGDTCQLFEELDPSEFRQQQGSAILRPDGRQREMLEAVRRLADALIADDEEAQEEPDHE